MVFQSSCDSSRTPRELPIKKVHFPRLYRPIPCPLQEIADHPNPAGSRSASPPGSLGCRPRRDHPVACARFAISDRARLLVIRCLPSPVNQRDHVVSLGAGDPGRVPLKPGHPNPVERVGRRGRHGPRIAPSIGCPGLCRLQQTPRSGPARCAPGHTNTPAAVIGRFGC
jgi:hypothetical protein